MLFHILDDHDGVIDHQTDGKHHGKKRQGIDGKAQDNEGAKSSHQGNRDGQQRDQRCAPCLKEQEHNDDNQRQRLEEGMHHLVQGSADKVRIVDDFMILHIRREGLGCILQEFLDLRNAVHRIGIAGKLDSKPNGLLIVVLGYDRAALFARLNARHILETRIGAIAGRFQHNLAEFLRGDQPSLHRAGILLLLRIRSGHLPDDARRRLNVLLLNGLGHVCHGKPPLRQLVGVHPDAHGVVRAKDLDLADARNALDGINQVDIRIVLQKLRLIGSVRGYDGYDQCHGR